MSVQWVITLSGSIQSKSPSLDLEQQTSKCLVYLSLGTRILENCQRFFVVFDFFLFDSNTWKALEEAI